MRFNNFCTLTVKDTKNKIKLTKVIFVDDVLPYLREAEKHGISSYHISSFLDWNYENNKGKIE